MSAISNVYDLEGVIEETLATVLRGYAFTVSTPNDTSFQKTRPRLELTVIVSGGMNRPLAEECVHPAIGQLRETAFKMQAKIEVISGVDISAHRELRADIRYRMGKICPALNLVATMPNHFIHRCQDAGSSPAYQGDGGYYQSTLLYDLDVQIQPDAWASLN